MTVVGQLLARRRSKHAKPGTGISTRDWRFIAGYLALLPLKKAALEIDKRFVEYLLELSDGVTGRIIEVLRRAAFQANADKSQKGGASAARICGSPYAVSHRPKVV